jgi:hypothetical protein
MKTPPLLLGATLAFWGWQTGLLPAGLAMAVILEGARLVRTRWDLSDEDFTRVWTFCSVLLLAAAVYVFNANDGRSQFGHLFRNPSLLNQSAAGVATARSITALFRWLPMIFFPFVAAQIYSSRQEIPLTTISLILRWRWRKAGKAGRQMMAARGVNLSFPYFGMCLFAASNHPSENDLYFWGLCALLAWALWPRRSLRFGIPVWLTAFGLAVALGFVGQRNVGRLQNYISNLNPQLLSRLMRRGTDPSQTRTSLGQIGRLKQSGRIVIWLQPGLGPVPAYLREASYRVYDPPFWSVGRGQNNFQGWNAEPTNLTTWILLADKTKSARVGIACYLEGQTRDGEPVGLLPLPAGCARLENLPPIVSVSSNSTGAVLTEGVGFVQFDACYGPGKTIDSPPRNADSNAIPDAEKAALDETLARLPAHGDSLDDKLRALDGYFQSEFRYSVWQNRPHALATNETPLTRFLLHTHSGHCEYFATATVLLLRRMGIPARYAVGYAVHEISGTGYVVRQRDAHAWCLVWDHRAGSWQDFDTTPASWVEEESRRASPWQKLSDLWSWLGFQFAKFRWGQTHLREYLFLLLLPVLALLLYRILVRRKQLRKRPDPADAEEPVLWPGLDSEFYLIERKLSERGMLRRENETLTDWLERATGESALAPMRDPLRELLQLHYRCRFDPLGLDIETRERLTSGSKQVLAALENGVRPAEAQ